MLYVMIANNREKYQRSGRRISCVPPRPRCCRVRKSSRRAQTKGGVLSLGGAEAAKEGTEGRQLAAAL